MTQDIFAGLDVRVVLMAALTAATISLMMTWRARNVAVLAGHPVSPWSAVVPETVLGIVAGIGLALGIPELYPRLHTVVGVMMLASVGGILGPKLFDLVSSDGLGLLTSYLASAIKGPLGAWAAKQTAPKDGGSNDPS